MSINKDKQPVNKIKYDGSLNYAEGKSRTTSVWKNKTFSWSDLLKMLENPVETYETQKNIKVFLKQKDEIKDVGGIVGGWLKKENGNEDMYSNEVWLF